MKNSKKGVLYAIMAVVGLSGVSARADTPSWLKSRGTRFGTAATGARDWTKQAGADFYDWAGKHKKEIGIGLGAAAGAAALGTGTRYGYKTYKKRQAVRPTPEKSVFVLTEVEKNISGTLVPSTTVPPISDESAITGASVVLEKEQKRGADSKALLASIRAGGGALKPVVPKPSKPIELNIFDNPMFQKIRQQVQREEEADDDEDWD